MQTLVGWIPTRIGPNCKTGCVTKTKPNVERNPKVGEKRWDNEEGGEGSVQGGECAQNILYKMCIEFNNTLQKRIPIKDTQTHIGSNSGRHSSSTSSLHTLEYVHTLTPHKHAHIKKTNILFRHGPSVSNHLFHTCSDICLHRVWQGGLSHPCLLHLTFPLPIPRALWLSFLPSLSMYWFLSLEYLSLLYQIRLIHPSGFVSSITQKTFHGDINFT